MGNYTGGFASFITSLKSPFVLNDLPTQLARFKFRKLPVVRNRFTWSCCSEVDQIWEVSQVSTFFSSWTKTGDKSVNLILFRQAKFRKAQSWKCVFKYCLLVDSARVDEPYMVLHSVQLTLSCKFCDKHFQI